MAAPRSDSTLPSPDYLTPSPRSHSIVAVNIILSVLATVIVFTRLFTRTKLLRSVGIDDWLIVVGLGLAWSLALWNSIGTAWGLGRHVWDVPKENWEGVGKIIWGTTSLYFPTLGFIKLSVLFSLRRITPSALGRHFIYYTMAFVGVLTIGITFANVFQCRPFAMIYAFSPRRPWVQWGSELEGKCLDRAALFYTSGGLNVLSDLVIWGIPMPMLWRLGWPWRQKLALVGVFSLGGIACIASIARIGILHELLFSPDLTWVIHKYSITSCLEISLGIICASSPSLKPFLAKYLPSLLGKDAQSNESNRWSLGSSVVQRGRTRNYNAVADVDESAIGGPGRGGRLGTGRLSWYSEQVLKAEEEARRYQAQQDAEDEVRKKLKKQSNLNVGIKRTTTWKSITSTISRSATLISKPATWGMGRSSFSADSDARSKYESPVDIVDAVPPLPPLPSVSASTQNTLPENTNTTAAMLLPTHPPDTAPYITTPPPASQKFKSLPFKLTTTNPAQYHTLPDADPDPTDPDEARFTPSPSPRSPLQRIGSWGKSKFRELRGESARNPELLTPTTYVYEARYDIPHRGAPETNKDVNTAYNVIDEEGDKPNSLKKDGMSTIKEKEEVTVASGSTLHPQSQAQPQPQSQLQSQSHNQSVPESPLQVTMGFRLDGPGEFNDFAYY